MSTNRRGSPEAIAKRKAARSLNSLFTGSEISDLDGRTQKRKNRLMRELKEGRNGTTLKALDVLVVAHELFKLGENLSSLRRLKPRVPALPELNEDTVELIQEAQSLYGFNPDAWKLLGVNLERLDELLSSSDDGEPRGVIRRRSKADSDEAPRVSA